MAKRKQVLINLGNEVLGELDRVVEILRGSSLHVVYGVSATRTSAARIALAVGIRKILADGLPGTTGVEHVQEEKVEDVPAVPIAPSPSSGFRYPTPAGWDEMKAGSAVPDSMKRADAAYRAVGARRFEVADKDQIAEVYWSDDPEVQKKMQPIPPFRRVTDPTFGSALVVFRPRGVAG